MRRSHSKNPAVNRSLRHSVRDGVAYSVMAGCGETYFSAFAVFLRASTAQMGMLASLPPLLGSAAQLFSAWLGNRTGWRKSIILTGVYLQIFMWLPLIALPLLFPEQAPQLLIACVILYFACSHLAGPQWNSLMGDLVPERQRGRYFGLRTRLASVTSFVALIMAGLVLHYAEEQHAAVMGFIAIFSTAAVARMVSAYHLHRMLDPPRSGALTSLPSTTAVWRRLHHSPFVRFSIFVATMQFAVAIASPFFTLYMLRDLHYSYLMFMTNTASSVLMQFLTLNAWGRISDRFGNRVILAATGLTIPLLPPLWLVSTNFWYLIAVQALGGLVWAGFSLSAANYIYDLVPSPKRATYVAYHTVLCSIGVFLGATLGGYLGMVLPIQLQLGGYSLEWGSVLLGVFLISGLARLTVALLFIPLLREVREVPPLPVSGLIFRVVRYNALAGLIFDFMLPRRRRKGANEDIPQ